MEITVNKDGQDLGPFTLDDLQAELASGNLTTEDFAWFEGCDDWVSIADVPGINDESTEAIDGIYLEKDGEQTGPFPLAQVQGMLNQGELSTEDPAWVDGWADWGTLGDVPNLKKPRVRVKAGGSPLSGIAPTSAGNGEKKSRKQPKVEESEEPEEKKAKRGRKRKEKKKKGGVMRIAVPIAAVLILGILGVVGYIVAKGMMEGDTAIDSLRDKVVKEEPPPEHDPWLLTEWRDKRRKG